MRGVGFVERKVVSAYDRERELEADVEAWVGA